LFYPGGGVVGSLPCTILGSATKRLKESVFYPGGGVVGSLPCTILDSATKRLKESDLVVTQPSNNFDRYSHRK